MGSKLFSIDVRTKHDFAEEKKKKQFYLHSRISCLKQHNVTVLIEM